LSEGLPLTRSLDDVTWISAEASQAKASMYAVRLDDNWVDATAQSTNPNQNEDRRLLSEGLNILAGMARGVTFDVVAAGEGTFERLSREMTGYYILAFEADPTERDGKPHRLTVDLKRPGLEIRSRREFIARPPSAPARSAEDLARARVLDQQGTKAFVDGRYNDAIRYYEEAYRLGGPPFELWNIAKCYVRLDQPEQATEMLVGDITFVAARPMTMTGASRPPA
jgi:tetratricopeptide (TPR) repeat protein